MFFVRHNVCFVGVVVLVQLFQGTKQGKSHFAYNIFLSPIFIENRFDCLCHDINFSWLVCVSPCMHLHSLFQFRFERSSLGCLLTMPFPKIDINFFHYAIWSSLFFSSIWVGRFIVVLWFNIFIIVVVVIAVYHYCNSYIWWWVIKILFECECIRYPNVNFVTDNNDVYRCCRWKSYGKL